MSKTRYIAFTSILSLMWVLDHKVAMAVLQQTKNNVALMVTDLDRAVPVYSGGSTVKATASSNSYIKCLPGQYLPAGATKCSLCRENYYCPGGSFYRSTVEQGIKKCSSSTWSASAASMCVNRIRCNAGTYLPAFAVQCSTCKENYYCPGGWWGYSSTNQGLMPCRSGQTSTVGMALCYKKATGTSGFKATCSPGQYLPAAAQYCTHCRQNFYCPGGTFYWAPYDQGVKACPAGKKSFNAASKCSTSYDCSAGQYLPANATTCATCKENYYCPGGNFIRTTHDQGLLPCKGAFTSQPGANKCYLRVANLNTEVKVNCNPGYYLPAYSAVCTTACRENYYCPGGRFGVSEYNQGIKSCPYGQTSNLGARSCYTKSNSTSISTSSGGAATYTCSSGYYLPANAKSCSACLAEHNCPGGTWNKSRSKPQGIFFSVSFEEMKSGPSGTGTECWKFIDKKQYKDCIMGLYSVK